MSFNLCSTTRNAATLLFGPGHLLSCKLANWQHQVQLPHSLIERNAFVIDGRSKGERMQ